MPFDSGGLFSLVPSYKATAGQTIRTEQHNPVLEDIANALSSVLKRDGRDGMVGALNMGSFPITNVAASQTATNAATVGQVQNALPIGAVIDYALQTLPPTWTWCNGSILFTSTPFPDLRQALISGGFPYGQDGSGNPKLPDARDVVIAGRGNMGGSSRGLLSKFASSLLGAMFGSQEHKLTVLESASHGHTGTANPPGSHTHALIIALASGVGSGNGLVPGPPAGVDRGYGTDSGTSHSHSLDINPTGGDQPHNNVQPTLIMNKIIKASYA